MLDSIKDAIMELSKYDAKHYKFDPDAFKNVRLQTLEERYKELQRRLDNLAWVKSKGGAIITREMANEMMIKKVVKSGYLCEWNGKEWVKISEATEYGIVVYYNLI